MKTDCMHHTAYATSPEVTAGHPHPCSMYGSMCVCVYSSLRPRLSVCRQVCSATACLLYLNQRGKVLLSLRSSCLQHDAHSGAQQTMTTQVEHEDVDNMQRERRGERKASEGTDDGGVQHIQSSHRTGTKLLHERRSLSSEAAQTVNPNRPDEQTATRRQYSQRQSPACLGSRGRRPPPTPEPPPSAACPGSWAP